MQAYGGGGWVLAVVLALFAAATNAGSSVLQRRAYREQAQQSGAGWRGLVGALRRPAWLGGMALLPASSLLGAAALSVGSVSVVQSLLCLELPMVLLLSAVVFHYRLRKRDWAAVAGMTVGTIALLYALSPSRGNPGAVSSLAWWLGAGGTGAAAGGLTAVAWFGGKRKPTRRAAVYGIASGVSFALAAVFIAADLADGISVALLWRWQTYLVIATTAAALALLQLGLQAGPLAAVSPGVTLADPLVAIGLSVTLFHENVRTAAWLVPEAVAAAAIAWGTFQLSSSPMLASSPPPPQSPGEKAERTASTST
jgi:drug/metabolite transporter (DMT)-like permease